MNRRVVWKIMLSAAVVTFPLFLLAMFVVCNTQNPFGLAFLTTFDVVNQTDELLNVTPIGAVGSRGDRHLLPFSVSDSYALSGIKRSEFEVKAQSSRTFIYDWDDIQFSEILVRRADGNYHYLTTGLDPIERQYSYPAQNRFVISNLEALPVAEDHLLAALADQSERSQATFYAFIGIGLLSPICFGLAFLIRKWTQRES